MQRRRDLIWETYSNYFVYIYYKHSKILERWPSGYGVWYARFQSPLRISLIVFLDSSDLSFSLEAQPS